jgi:hypothetical protein
MGTQPPLPVKSRLNTGRLTGATSNTEILGTQHVRRDKLVHYDATDAATKHITKDAHLEFVRKTGNSNNKKQHKQEAAKTRSSKNKKQHAVGCEYIHIEANCSQFTV